MNKYREESREAFQEGAIVLTESSATPALTLAVIDNIVVSPVHQCLKLPIRGEEGGGNKVRCGCESATLLPPGRSDLGGIVSGRQEFMIQESFNRLFGGDVLPAETGDAGGMLEPVV